MQKSILLTSFTTWKPEQVTNSSDDLVGAFLSANPHWRNLRTIRQLPVDFERAPEIAIAAIDRFRPDLVICCGMAEKRDRLNLESRAVVDEEVLTTGLDLALLIQGLEMTDISEDAGQFVCNRLYYELLKDTAQQGGDRHCLFIHVPVLTPENRSAILSDFQRLLQRLAQPAVLQAVS